MFKTDVCEYCFSKEHERWCKIGNPRIKYAFDAVADDERLSPGDRLILHALGVAWIKIVKKLC